LVGFVAPFQPARPLAKLVRVEAKLARVPVNRVLADVKPVQSSNEPPLPIWMLRSRYWANGPLAAPYRWTFEARLPV
jgi:hypothetical protein